MQSFQPIRWRKSALSSYRPLFALLCADAVSMNGNALAQLAIPWYVLETTGSVTKTGIVAFFSLLPLILAAFFGGPLVDALGHKRASILADVASGVSIALIPLLHTTIGLDFPYFVLLVFLGALFDTPGATARAALLPEAARTANFSLERVNMLHEVLESGAQFCGPLLAGVLITWFGVNNVLWFDAATFIASALLVVYSGSTYTHRQPAAQSCDYRRELMEGLRFVWNDRAIRCIFVSATILNFLISPMMVVILPAYMNIVYQSAISLGVVIAAFGGGSVIGAVGYGVVGYRFSRRRTFVVGVAAMGAAFATLTVMPPVAVMVGVMLLAGVISGPNGPLVSTVLQERTPIDLRGRVFGVTTAVGFAAAPVGVVLAGYLLDDIGFQPILIGIALLFALVTGWLSLDPALRLIER